MIRSPEASRRVGIAEIIFGVVIAMFGIVAHVWFAFVVAALAILFGLFILMRTRQQAGGRGGDHGSSRS